MMLLIMLPGFRRGVAARRTLAVASSGFAGSAIVTLGMFAYQTATGALYFGVVLLMSCFMLGTVAGAFTGNRAITGAKPHGHRPGQDRGFLLAEALLVAVPVLMVVVGDRIPGWTQFPLLTLTGWAVGFQFPVAAAIVGGAARPQPGFDIPGAGRTVGRLTAVDLLGGILGLLLLPLVVLPLAGLGWAFALVAAVKLASLAVQAVHDRPGAAAPGAVKL